MNSQSLKPHCDAECLFVTMPNIYLHCPPLLRVLYVLGLRHAPEADAPRPVETVSHQEVGVVPLQGADTRG